MAAKRIGIVGPHTDADVQELKAAIEDRGGEARTIDLELFPSVVKASIGLDEIIFDDMKLLDFDAFYLRRVAAMWYLPPRTFTKEEWVKHYGTFNDYMANVRATLSFKTSMVRILCDRKLVINPYESWGYHHLKLHQFWILKENGFKVPEFVGGNNYFSLKQFLGNRHAVHKRTVTGLVQTVDLSKLDSERESLRNRPTVYQEFIRGKSVRAFVLGDDVIAACELPHKEEGVDASEHIEYMRRIDLPKKMQNEIVRAAKALGLIFSGVDLQYEESAGEYYFLECNSAPFFRPYDTQVEAGIGGKLADFLLERS
jgi:glutathione synthase/RimK-type ligase-like ATP-grasp enzyme